MNRQYGFTLIELLVTLALLGLLAAVAFPLAELQSKRRHEEELSAALRDIRQAIDAYKRASDEERIKTPADASGYPPTLNDLVEGVPDQTDPAAPKIYFLRRLPPDPMCACPGEAPEATWRLRSYASPPDHPEAGKDVFDVMSKSADVGLNGVPYDQW
jgi:general secretion pathway protein G